MAVISGLPVAVDGMGGDHAPQEIVAGAAKAHEAGFPVVLVGDPQRMEAQGLSVIAASEVIEMDEEPGQAVRRKRDSSVVRAAEAVRRGEACAMVSAGNTGAAMAAALLRMGRIRGVARPAIATTLPIPGSLPTVLIDSGANAECSAAWLVQFAQMGSVYYRIRHGVAEPKVGLLSIGEEAGKGNSLVKEAHEALARTKELNFIGNVEGRDVLTDRVEVVVTDGFTGNVVLKTLEGAMRFFMGALKGVFRSSEEAMRAGAALAPALAPLAEQLDPESQGGAILLGVDGVCVISHGASSAKAIANAVRVAYELAQANVVDQLATAVSGEER